MNNMPDINVITPGLLTTVQDSGRLGFQQYGIPVSGAMDRYSLETANVLAGNCRNAAALEITFSGPVLEFKSSMAIAITGADMEPSVNGNPVEAYEAIYVKPGDVLSFGALKKGLRTYVAFEGGIDVPLVMQSRSTYLKAGIGGFQGRKLRAGDTLQVAPVKGHISSGIRKIPGSMIPGYGSEIPVRVIMGPEDDSFTPEGISCFLSNEYTVGSHSDRMGLRMQGPVIEHKNGADILSSGINFGSIQVAGEGQPIILMADRQPTGGYTRIAGVISADLPLVAQAKPGDRLRFQDVGVELAQRLIKERENEINGLIELFSGHDYEADKNIRRLQLKINGKMYETSVVEI